MSTPVVLYPKRKGKQLTNVAGEGFAPVVNQINQTINAASKETRAIGIIAVEATTNLSVADGKAYVLVPAALNGKNLTRAVAVVNTAGTTNPTTIDIYNVTDSVDMLSTAISIASGGTVGTEGIVSSSNSGVITNDVLRVDVTTMSTTAPKGLLVVLEFRSS